MQFDPSQFNKEILLENGFFNLLDKIRTAKIELPHHPEMLSGETYIEKWFEDSKITIVDGDLHSKTGKLDEKKGIELLKDPSILISAYDESINRYSALEGKAFYVSHSLVSLYEERYYPLNKLTLLFVTGSEKIKNQIPGAIKTVEKWGMDTTANVEIARQKREFLEKNCYKNSILLIDGPFLAGDGMATFKGIIDEMFIDQDIFPVFIVKNSYSKLIVDNYPQYRGQYNSDLHLMNDILSPGERSPFYVYTDTYSKDNTKVFCYVKFYKKSSPIRIEIPTKIYLKNIRAVDSIMDLIYYLILVQGDPINPQARPIAIAEKYARATLKLVDFNRNMNISKLTPTMNEKRGMEID